MFTGHTLLIDTVLHWVELPSSPALLITRPWTIISYMFAQYDLIHILFNMLWLYWFGTMFRMCCTARQMMALYIIGGIAGGLLFIVAYNCLPVFIHSTGWLIGSSASVIAIVTATAILMPDFRMHLFLIGAVSLKWIAIATIVLVLVGISGTNAGGEISHVGGILAGALFATRLRKGHDITAGPNRVIDNIVNAFKGIRRPAPAPRRTSTPRMSDADRRELDIILDKIKKSGYSALTPAERKRLFDLSRNIRN